MLTIPGWGLWLMMLASALGTFLLLCQLKATGWRL
jgi:hypothetical protein